MLEPKCIVTFCKNRPGKTKGVAFYRLTEKRYERWMQAVGRDPAEKLSVLHSAICSDHFSAESFRYINNRKILKRMALPTINLRPPRQTFQHLKDGQVIPLQLLQLTAKDTVTPVKYPSDTLMKPVSSWHLENTVSKLPSSRAATKLSFSQKNVNSFCKSVEDKSYPGKNVIKNHDKSPIKDACNLKGTIKKRYSVRMWNNYYVCSRKQKNKLNMIRKESRHMKKELKMATSSINILASDVRRLIERIDDLTDIVKLSVKR